MNKIYDNDSESIRMKKNIMVTILKEYISTSLAKLTVDYAINYEIKGVKINDNAGVKINDNVGAININCDNKNGSCIKWIAAKKNKLYILESRQCLRNVHPHNMYLTFYIHIIDVSLNVANNSFELELPGNEKYYKFAK